MNYTACKWCIILSDIKSKIVNICCAVFTILLFAGNDIMIIQTKMIFLRKNT